MIKLSKTEVKELFEVISEDNLEYGLIFKLCYVYGRLVSEVYSLHRDDVDFKENKISFRINNTMVDYPLHSSVYDDLKVQVDETSDYLFQHIGKDINNFSSKLNYFLKKYDQDYGVHVSPREFKKLRGQHLLLDGVKVNSISRLYYSKDNSATRRLIDYDELVGLVNDVDVVMILDEFTVL